MIIAYGQRNFGEKQRLEKDYFRLIIHTYIHILSYGEHLEVFPSISIANIFIIENTVRFSLSYAPIQFVFKIAHDRYIHSLLPTLMKLAWITPWHLCSETHHEMLPYSILSLYRLRLRTYPFRHSNLTTPEFYSFNII